jgi:HEPN domain-containing protein
MNEEVHKWIKQAEHDLQMAQNIIDDGGYDICAFLCQQAAEKYLKALFIIEKKKAPPRIHYLDELGKALGTPDNVLQLLKELSADYMVTRYPDATTMAPCEEYSLEDAEKRLQSAKTVIGWVKAKLK